jgi:hypothetical protein
VTGTIEGNGGVDTRAPVWSQRVLIPRFDREGVARVAVDDRILERCHVARKEATSDMRKRSQGWSYVYMVF